MLLYSDVLNDFGEHLFVIFIPLLSSVVVNDLNVITNEEVFTIIICCHHMFCVS